MFLTQIGGAAVTIIGLLGSLIAPVGTSAPTHAPNASLFASPITTSSAKLGDKLEQYASSTERVDQVTTDELISSIDPADFSTASGLLLNLSEATADKVTAGGYVLHVPFENQTDYLSISSYTVMFNDDRSVAGTGEALYTPISSTSGNLRLWLDGEIKLDRTVAEASTSQTGNTTQPAFNGGVLNQCLLDAGIAQWAVTAVGIACGVICGATLGVGCAACVAAAGGIIGATAGHCVAKAMTA